MRLTIKAMKLNLKLFCCLIPLLSTSIPFAQIFRIIAEQDSSELPFCSIINYTQPSFVTANRFGVAEIYAQIGDSITVSLVGYKTKSIIFNSNTPQTICLVKETYNLPPVTIKTCRNTKLVKGTNKNSVNYITKDDGNRYYFDGFSWWGWWSNVKWAVRILPEIENSSLKSYSFWLKKANFGSKESMKAPLIIEIYDVTDSILPGNLLTDVPIIYYPQKKGKQILNLDSLQLRIPPMGIYISFQSVMTEDNTWGQHIKFKDSTSGMLKDTLVKCYGGVIDGVYSSNFELAGFNLKNNKWFLLDQNLDRNDGLHNSIKCEAVLTSCEE